MPPRRRQSMVSLSMASMPEESALPDLPTAVRAYSIMLSIDSLIWFQQQPDQTPPADDLPPQRYYIL
jgi:hypothetical protein